ncbi:hypothetical protein NL676_014564 [Syzygium grande]|nr:hypothetical protein NL676_014564 [Syzygium grande]
MSLQVVKKMENALAFKGNSQDLPLSSSYEAAMEALSSLITHQKRGDPTPVAGKFGKLERMSIYLRILGLEEKNARLKIIHVAGTKGKVFYMEVIVDIFSRNQLLPLHLYLNSVI